MKTKVIVEKTAEVDFNVLVSKVKGEEEHRIAMNGEPFGDGAGEAVLVLTFRKRDLESPTPDGANAEGEIHIVGKGTPGELIEALVTGGMMDEKLAMILCLAATQLVDAMHRAAAKDARQACYLGRKEGRC